MADMLGTLFGRTRWGYTVASFSFLSHVVDASTEGVGAVVQAMDTNAITHIGFRYGVRTGTPPTYIVGLESPSTSTGFPDGTVLGGGSPASATFTPPADTSWDGLWQWIALDNSYTPTLGQLLCPTIRYSSGTIDGSNNSSFTTHLANAEAAARIGDPYALRNTAGTWAKQNNQFIFGLRTASSRYGGIIESLPSVSLTASTVGLREALEFSLPSGCCTSYTVRGICLCGQFASGSGKAPVLGLWSSSSLLQSKTLDTEIINQHTNVNYSHHLYFDGPLATLSPGTTYYAGLEVADAASSALGLTCFGVGSADDLGATEGGATCRRASYNGSAWSSHTTLRPFAHLILGDMTGGGGGSGGSSNLINGGYVR